jgi:hypothetical protein
MTFVTGWFTSITGGYMLMQEQRRREGNSAYGGRGGPYRGYCGGSPHRSFRSGSPQEQVEVDSATWTGAQPKPRTWRVFLHPKETA